MDLFSSDIFNFSSEAYKKEFGKPKRVLYNTVIIFLFSIFIALFFIKVPVTVQSNGLIKAQAEKTPLFAPTQGKIVFIRNNQIYEFRFLLWRFLS